MNENSSRPAATVFGHPRDYLDKRFVYAVISQRAGGLSIGVNLTPDRQCNFDCVYCEVNHQRPVRDTVVNLRVLEQELEEVLERVRQNRMRELPWLANARPEWLELKEVALSGDGEPTLCPEFCDVVETVTRLRAVRRQPFKLVLITNTSGLGKARVKRGLRRFAPTDEIWAKLDAGTQAHMNRVNHPGISLKEVLTNILDLARQRPVVIQSLFPEINGEEPPAKEIEEYARRLFELKQSGAQIALVQIYSAHRPPHRPDCGHLPLRVLNEIARRVRQVAGLRAEVF